MPGDSCVNGARGQSQRHPATASTAATLLRHANSVLSFYKTGLSSGKPPRRALCGMKGINRKIRGLIASAFGFRDRTSSNCVSMLSMNPSSNLSANTKLRHSPTEASAFATASFANQIG